MKGIWPVLLLVLLLMGCGGDQSSTSETEPQPTSGAGSTPSTTNETAPATPEDTRTRPETTGGATSPSSTAQRPASAAEATAYGYTYGQASGNRVIDGSGDLPNSRPVDVRLDGTPTWVAGVPLGTETAWVVTLEDGRVRAFRLNRSGETEEISISPDRLAPGQPPLVEVRGDSLKLVASRYEAASDLTHPAPVSSNGGEEQLGVGSGGQVFEEVSEGDSVGIGETGIEALPDARFVRGAGGTLAFLSTPTESYVHGVLGDEIEAESMTLLRPGEEQNLESGTIFPASGGVFEQISPLWFEASGIDSELLAVTESTAELATRVSVYNLAGDLVAAGPFIGEPYKWRHLIAAGPFGPNGEIELVDVLTPHIGGTVEFYRPDFEDGSLNIVATQSGYTSHRIYTRNMDTARAGDLDNDGRWELLVPNDSYTELGAIRRTQDGSETAWTLPADGTIITNLASTTNSEGRAQIAAGREDGTLRIWP